MAKTYRFFVTCPSGFEHQLSTELEKTGISSPVSKQGGAEFSGTLESGMMVCLWSRIAGKVLLAVEDFKCPDEREVYERARRIRWNDFFSAGKTIAVETTSLSREFANPSYLSLLVKDGISDYFRAASGRRPDVDKENADVRINLFINRGICTLSIDQIGRAHV